MKYAQCVLNEKTFIHRSHTGLCRTDMERDEEIQYIISKWERTASVIILLPLVADEVKYKLEGAYSN